MNKKEAVKELNAIDANDPERAHAQADSILLKAVPDEVREAYIRVTKRAPWWGAS